MTTVTNKDGIEFDIDALATDVNGKADKDLVNCTVPYVMSRTPNNKGGVVEIWSDGYCVQTGVISTNTNPYTLTFSQPFKDANYQIFKNIQLDSSQTTDVRGTMFFNLTRTSATTYTWNGEKENWRAEGYIR